MLKFDSVNRTIIDDDAALTPGIFSITADQIAGLVAEGATVADSAKAAASDPAGTALGAVNTANDAGGTAASSAGDAVNNAGVAGNTILAGLSTKNAVAAPGEDAAVSTPVTSDTDTVTDSSAVVPSGSSTDEAESTATTGVSPSTAVTDPAADAVPIVAGGADSTQVVTPADSVASSAASAVLGVATPVVQSDEGVVDAGQAVAAMDQPAVVAPVANAIPVDAVAATPGGTAVPVTTDETPSSIVTGTAAVAASDPTNPSVTGAAADSTQKASDAADAASRAESSAATASASADTSAADQEKADADAGVDTTKDIGTVTIAPDNLGSVTGLPVTPDGTPVVEAQPQAVTVAGATYPANSPIVAGTDDAAQSTNPFDGLSHESMLDKLLDDLEGIQNMGKSEIHFVVDSLRAAFHSKA